MKANEKNMDGINLTSIDINEIANLSDDDFDELLGHSTENELILVDARLSVDDLEYIESDDLDDVLLEDDPVWNDDEHVVR